jgi:hypothetical protein
MERAETTVIKKGSRATRGARTKSALERAMESTTQSLLTFKHLSPQDYKHEAH